MSFLEASYELPKSSSQYMKFVEGENKFRALGSAIVGWIDWEDTADGRKPVRTKDIQLSPAKHFWTFPVWDYQDEAVKILEITQVSIQKAIKNLIDNKVWGSPTGYDVVVKRVGKDLQTEYFVSSNPPAKFELTSEIKEEVANIDLEKLYSNENPFIDKSTPQTPAEKMREGAGLSVDEIPFG